MPALLPNVDPDGLLEYSVVFTDRSLNHMSQSFQQVMNDLSSNLKSVYQASGVAIVPGGGTYGMEAVARQFAQDKKCLVIRNGWFSFRWTQILDAAKLPSESKVMMAERQTDAIDSPFAPAQLDKVVEEILTFKPDLVFAPHVETSSGILLSDDYIKALSDAVHQVGGMMVLDCVASGTLWVDMKALGVDVLISAPQKGWSASPSSGLVMLSEKGEAELANTQSNSFACDLKKWRDIMKAYENGGHAYHATMPTDALKMFRDTLLEAKSIGFDKLKQAQIELGTKVRALLKEKCIQSVAAEGFEAPGVVVSYTQKDDWQNGSAFLTEGMQIAAGVPLQCNEPAEFKTFRVGLFGLDKLNNVDRTVEHFKNALENVGQ